jgi:hypothetical protein
VEHHVDPIERASHPNQASPDDLVGVQLLNKSRRVYQIAMSMS